MTRYVRQGGAWVEVGARIPAAGGVAIHRDFQAPLMCHADGQLHGSRSTYDAAVRAAGLVEVGRTEMRKQAAAVRDATKPESPRAMLRRLVDES